MTYKHVALLALLSFLAGLLGGAVSSRKVLVAEEFRVVDAHGHEWGAFGVAPGGSGRLVFYDRSGRVVWSAPQAAVHPAK